MLLKRFFQERGGSVLPLFAVVVVPIIGFMGVAIDYSRAASMRTEIQGALDATSLMLAKEVNGLSTSQVVEKANQYFNALFTRPGAKNIVLTPTVTSVNGVFTVKLGATASMDTTFTRLLGQSSMDVGSSTEVTWGTRKLELALALDNTGSMASSGKMTELKKASKGLLDTLYKIAKKTDDVRVAIIPFATDVNVDKTVNLNANWIDWADWESKNGTCSNDDYETKSECLSRGKTWTPKNHSAWNGCVWDRNQDYDADDTPPNVNVAGTLFQAHQASNCSTSMLPLVDILSNWVPGDLTSSSPTSTLGKKINAMAATGTTNVPIGLAWGWHALTSNEPLPQATVPKGDLDKVLILLTDGQNTQNRWSTSQTSIDARMKKVCDNLRTTTIKVYTVRVIEGNVDILRSCATKPDMYYDVQNATQLNAVFTTIAQKLAVLRIAK